MSKISGIYKIQSKIRPDRCYIGSSSNIGIRFKNHISELKSNRHQNQRLQNHFNKYGETDLQFSILLGCDKDDLIRIEQYFIDSYNPFFNICKTAGNINRIYSEETLKKMSESHKGLNTWIKGRKMSDEQKKKISQAFKGRIPWNKGKKMSPETCKKMSAALMGNTNSVGKTNGEKHYLFGKHHTEESKQKIRKKKLGTKMSEEARKNMSKSHKRRRLKNIA